MRRSFHAGVARFVAGLLALSACSGTGPIIDNWPTFNVRGTVRQQDGSPLVGVLVELRTYGVAECGVTPTVTYSSSVTDRQGRYQVFQSEPIGRLSGCLRLTAHPDTSVLSAPIAIADTIVNDIPLGQGETSFTMDLRSP